MIAGAYTFNTGQAFAGAAFVYHGEALDVEVENLVYREDFIDESAYPTSPEVGLLALGGLSAATFGPGQFALDLDGSALNLAVLASPAFDGANVSLDASPIGNGDFRIAAHFDEYSQLYSSGGYQVFALVADFPDESNRVYYLLNMTSVGFPDRHPFVGAGVAGNITLVPMSTAEYWAIRSGSPFSIEMRINRQLSSVSGKVHVDGFAPFLGPTVYVPFCAAGATNAGMETRPEADPNFPGDRFSIRLTEITLPEPGSLETLLAGAAMLLGMGRRRFRSLPA